MRNHLFDSSAEVAEFQERFGYAALSDAARTKIFGLNAARIYNISTDDILRSVRNDAIAIAQENYRNNPTPHSRTYGPRTRREFFDLISATKSPI